MMEINLSVHSNLDMVFQGHSRHTMSKALVRSTNVKLMSLYCCWHFSSSLRVAKIMSVLYLGLSAIDTRSQL